MTPILESRQKAALVWNEARVSYDELLRRAWGCSHRLGPLDERVVVFSENRPEWVYAAYGIWAAGRALVPIDAMSTAEEVAYILDDCRPGSVFCSERLRDTMQRAIEQADHQPRVVALEALAEGDAKEADEPPAPIRRDEAELAAIVYTSGTTGDPKGVMLTFGNLLTNLRAVVDAGYFGPEARTLLLLPLHHVLPLAGSLMAPLISGSTIVFATSLAGPDLVATLQRSAVTSIIGVPRFYDMLHRALHERIDASAVARVLYAIAARLRSRRLSRLVFGSVHRRFGGALRFMISGGAALSLETARTFDTLGFEVCEGYGMTECAPMITFPRVGAAKLGACGQALPGCEVRVTDEGEIVAHGPNIMRGYYGRDEETAAVLRNGWLHTGDLGRLDKAGYLTVTGRLKEIIVLSSGKNVNPVTIEEALSVADAIREVGVFLDEDTLHALIVPSWEHLPVTERSEAESWLRREVLEPYNASVAPYRRVQRVTIVGEDLPRTRLGKLRRHQLGAIAREVARARGAKADASEARDEATARLVGFLERQYRCSVSGHSRLEADVGVDSLGRVELAVFLERAFGLAIPEARLADFETVGDLARFVAEFSGGGGEEQEMSWAEALTPERRPPLPRSSVWHRILVYGSRTFVRLYFRVKVRGQERLPAEPCILAPNHQSFLDGLFVTAFMRPALVLRTLFYAKERHVRKWWLKFLAHRSNTIVMNANEGFLQSLQKLAAGLRRGDNVMIFPEGTRSRGGALGTFKESYAILARELGVPVVPVVIDGAHAVLPTGSRIPRVRGKVVVTYLEPVRPHEGEPLSTFNDRVRTLISEHLRRPETA